MTRTYFIQSARTSNGGFIALTSAVIISMILLAITFSLSLSGYFSRFNVLNAEFKKQSVALAEACGDMALLMLAKDRVIATTTSIAIGADTCTIFPAQNDVPIVGQTTIKTQAIFQKAVTNLVIIATNASASVISWEEVPN